MPIACLQNQLRKVGYALHTNLAPLRMGRRQRARQIDRAAAGIDHDLERAIMENARIRCTADFKEGVASFLEKRKPVWQSKPED